ncbi:hypothetical protein C6Y45_07690 [Alkalicoccus saliphilus]|uniref:Uncharacterized protein n=1 Tax=Alkalicoccus saliphilus TaxID=200989 RepID=A0A2T4U6Q9_9BACI|nr:hypothetical protein C6Y45_07690 [Alkalicoccus saliphilus]
MKESSLLGELSFFDRISSDGGKASADRESLSPGGFVIIAIPTALPLWQVLRRFILKETLQKAASRE